MTDEEYREYLSALASRHLAPFWQHDLDVRVMDHAIERIASVTRFVRVVSERFDNPFLLKELSHALEESHSVDTVVSVMERIGILAALDEAPEITFGSLRRSAIPREDTEFLRRAGIDSPDAEITLIIHYGRLHLGSLSMSERGSLGRKAPYPSEIARQAQAALQGAVGKLEKMASQVSENQPIAKKRKVFNGIGKILAGVVTGAGNILLGAGTVVAPNPATAYGVIASSAVAIGGMFQGIGDLRGE